MGSCGNGEDKGVARGAREKDREIEKGGFFGGRDGRPRMSEGKEGKSSFSLSLICEARRARYGWRKRGSGGDRCMWEGRSIQPQQNPILHPKPSIASRG